MNIVFVFGFELEIFVNPIFTFKFSLKCKQRKCVCVLFGVVKKGYCHVFLLSWLSICFCRGFLGSKDYCVSCKNYVTRKFLLTSLIFSR